MDMVEVRGGWDRTAGRGEVVYKLPVGEGLVTCSGGLVRGTNKESMLTWERLVLVYHAFFPILGSFVNALQILGHMVNVC